MKSTPPSMPGPCSLFWRDLKFQRAIKTIVFSLFAAAGIWWVAQPVPSAVKVENSPVEIWALQWGPVVGLTVAALSLLYALRRCFWIQKVLCHGVLIKGIAEGVDVYEYERSSSNTSTPFNRPKSYSYYVIIRFPCQGEDRKIRFKLPHSPSTYKIYKDKEVDLLALESAPGKPLIRELYLGRF